MGSEERCHHDGLVDCEDKGHRRDGCVEEVRDEDEAEGGLN